MSCRKEGADPPNTLFGREDSLRSDQHFKWMPLKPMFSIAHEEVLVEITHEVPESGEGDQREAQVREFLLTCFLKLPTLILKATPNFRLLIILKATRNSGLLIIKTQGVRLHQHFSPEPVFAG